MLVDASILNISALAVLVCAEECRLGLVRAPCSHFHVPRSLTFAPASRTAGLRSVAETKSGPQSGAYSTKTLRSRQKRANTDGGKVRIAQVIFSSDVFYVR